MRTVMAERNAGESRASFLHRGLLPRDIRDQGLALCRSQYLRNIARQLRDLLCRRVHCAKMRDAQRLDCIALKRVGGEQLQQLCMSAAHLLVHRAKIDEQWLQQRGDLGFLRGRDLDVGKHLFDVRLCVSATDWAVQRVCSCGPVREGDRRTTANKAGD